MSHVVHDSLQRHLVVTGRGYVSPNPANQRRNKSNEEKNTELRSTQIVSEITFIDDYWKIIWFTHTSQNCLVETQNSEKTYNTSDEQQHDRDDQKVNASTARLDQVLQENGLWQCPQSHAQTETAANLQRALSVYV